MPPQKKNKALVVLALLVFVPFLALSKMRGLRDGSSVATVPGAEASGGFSPFLIIVILLVVVAFALAGAFLMKK